MPIYDIKAPDGKIYSVKAPEGATEQQAIAYLRRTQFKPSAPSEPAPTPTQPELEKSPIEDVLEEVPLVGDFLTGTADVGLGTVQGLAGVTGAATEAFGADNRVSRFFEDIAQGAQALMSAEERGDLAEGQRIMQEAEDKGILEQVKAAAKAFSKSPLTLGAQAVGSALPFVAATIATGGGAAVPLGLGAVTGAGIVKGSIYDTVEAEALKEGLTQEQAAAMADAAQAYGGENLDMIALGTVLGGVASRFGLERGVAKALGDKVSKNVLGRALATGTGEAVTETAQAGQERLAGNLAAQRAGYDVPLGRGVAGQAALEGIMGGVAGAGASTVLGPRQAAAPYVGEDTADAPARKAELLDSLLKQGVPERQALAVVDGVAAYEAQERAKAKAAKDKAKKQPETEQVAPVDEAEEATEVEATAAPVDESEEVTEVEATAAAVSEQPAPKKRRGRPTEAARTEDFELQNKALELYPKKNQANPRDAWFNGASGVPLADYTAGLGRELTAASKKAFAEGAKWRESQAAPIATEEVAVAETPAVDRMAALAEAGRRFPEEGPLENAFYTGAIGDELTPGILAGLDSTGVGLAQQAFEQGVKWRTGQEGTTDEQSVESVADIESDGESVESSLSASDRRVSGTAEAASEVEGLVGGGVDVSSSDVGVDTERGGVSQPALKGAPVTKVAPGVARGVKETRRGTQGTTRGAPVRGASELTAGMQAQQGLMAELNEARDRGEISDQDRAEIAGILRRPETKEEFAALPEEAQIAWTMGTDAQKNVDDRLAYIDELKKELEIKRAKGKGGVRAVKKELKQAEESLPALQKPLDATQEVVVDAARSELNRRKEERVETQIAIRSLLKDPNLTNEQRRDLEVALQQSIVTLYEVAGGPEMSRRGFLVGTAAAVGASMLPAPVTASPRTINANLTALLEAGDINGALDWVAKNADNPIYKTIAKKIRKFGLGNTTLRVIGAASEQWDANGEVNLDPNTNSLLITLYGGKGRSVETFLHEAIHAYVAARWGMLQNTDAAIEEVGLSLGRGKAEIRKFKDLWYSIGNAIILHNSDLLAGRTREMWAREFVRSPDEALSWVMTNSDLRTFLNSIDVEGEPLTPGAKSLWERIGDYIRELFGMPPTPATKSALAAILASGMDILSVGQYVAPDARIVSEIGKLSSPQLFEKSEILGRFSGTLEGLRHSSEDPNLRVVDSAELSEGARFDGNVFGNGGMYLAADPKWLDGSIRFFNPYVYDVSVKFDNAFVLSPDNLAAFVDLVGVSDNRLSPHGQTIDKLKSAGFDGLIVEGFDALKSWETVEKAENKKLKPIRKKSDKLNIPQVKVPGYDKALNEAHRDAARKLFGNTLDNVPDNFLEGYIAELQDQIVAFDPQRQVAIESSARKYDDANPEAFSAMETVRVRPQEPVRDAAAPLLLPPISLRLFEKAEEDISTGLKKVQNSVEASDVASGVQQAVDGAKEKYKLGFRSWWADTFGPLKLPKNFLVTSSIIRGLKDTAPAAGNIAEEIVDVTRQMRGMTDSMTRAAERLGVSLKKWTTSAEGNMQKMATAMQLARNNNNDPSAYASIEDNLKNDPPMKKIRSEQRKTKIPANKKKLKKSLDARTKHIKETWAEYNKLDAAGKAEYKKQREYYQAMDPALRVSLDGLIDFYIKDKQVAQTLRDKVRDVGVEEESEYEGVEASLLPNVYFPFMRFGDYAVVLRSPKGKKAKKGFARKRFHADTPGEQIRLTEYLKQKYAAQIADGTYELTTPDMSELRAEDANESIILQQMFAAIDRIEMGGIKDTDVAAFKERARDSVYQVWLMTLPERSLRKQFIHADRVEGQSSDVNRVFASASTRYASQLPKLIARPQIDRLASEGKASFEGMSAVQDPIKAEKLKNAFNTIVVRAEEELSPPPLSPFVRIANQTAFGLFMSNFMSAFLQTTAFPMQAMPRMLVRYGDQTGLMAKYIALIKDIPAMPLQETPGTGERYVAMPSIENTAFIKNNPLRKKLFEQFKLRGFMRQTYSSSVLGKMSRPSKSSLQSASELYNTAVSIVGAPVSALDQLTREMTTMMFAEMEYNKNGGDFEAAVKSAMKNTDQTIGDYTDLEQFGAFRGNFGRFFRFLRSYSVQRAVYYARQLKAIYKADPDLQQTKTEAFSELMLVSGMSALFGGAAAVAGYSAFTLMFSLMFGALYDDEEKKEFEERYPNSVVNGKLDADYHFRYVLIPNLFGEDSGLSTAVQKGAVSYALNADISSRVSQNDLFIRDWQDGDSTFDTFVNFATTNLSPQLSAAKGVADGFDMIARGDFAKGVKKLTPGYVGNPMVAAEYKEEGMRTATGAPIFGPEEFNKEVDRGFNPDTVVALGAVPLDIGIERERRIQPMFERKREYQGRQRELMSSFKKEYLSRAPDQEELAEITQDIVEFNASLPAALAKDYLIDNKRMSESILRTLRVDRFRGYEVSDGEMLTQLMAEGKITPEQYNMLANMLLAERYK